MFFDEDRRHWIVFNVKQVNAVVKDEKRNPNFASSSLRDEVFVILEVQKGVPMIEPPQTKPEPGLEGHRQLFEAPYQLHEWTWSQFHKYFSGE